MTTNLSISSRLLRRYYPEREKDALCSSFCAHAQPGMNVLDAGCGWVRGCPLVAPLEKMYIVGIDKDPKVHENKRCNETIICDLNKPLPLSDNSFDIVHCRWVIEHLEDPTITFREFARVLKQGGYLLVLTPNVWHYATIAARITPYWFHRYWIGAGEGEVFPAYYRANSRRKLRHLCKDAGLRIKRLDLLEGSPDEYLGRHWPLLLFGIFYERVVNFTPKLSWMRHSIFLEAEKPSEHFCEQTNVV